MSGAVKTIIALALAATMAAALVTPLALSASTSAASLYNRGNELYKSGNFEEAAKTYEEALKTGVRDPDLYYNLANARLRTGELGQAAANYLRARELAPRDPDIAFNLALARERIRARLPDIPKGPFTRAFDAVAGYLSANEWTILVACLYWVLAALVVLRLVSGRETLTRASLAGIRVAAVLLAIALPFAAAGVKRDLLTPRAVVMADKSVARSGPGEDNAELFELFEGMDVTVSSCDSGWCRVSAPGGFIGWVKAEDVERL